MEMDDYDNDHDRERMQEDDPSAFEVAEGIFSSKKCEPKKKETTKSDEKKKKKSDEKKKKKKGDEKKKKKSGCECKPSSASKQGLKGSQEKLRRAVNPFIVFYLKIYYEQPNKKVTEVARAAAKLWCRMSDKEKEAYIKIAREESARRQKMQNKNKKKC